MLLLTSAIDPGVLFPGEGPFTHVRAEKLRINQRDAALVFDVSFGTLVDSAYVPSEKVGLHEHVLADADGTGAYTNFIASYSAQGNEAALTALIRCCEQWLLDEGHFVGTLA